MDDASGTTAPEDAAVAVYGDNRQAALLFEGITKLVDREPNRTFANDEVRTSARKLARLLYVRLDGHDPEADDNEWPPPRVGQASTRAEPD